MARSFSRGLIAVLALAAASASYAGPIGIQLQAYPNEAVADGRSTIAITLYVRNSDGSNVPDGTQVLLNTSLGTFRQNIVTTTSGVARAVLVAGNIPGIAKVTANTITAQSSPSVLEVEFVSDRSKLSSANDFTEIASSSSLEYTFAKKIVTASAPKQGVRFQYRDYVIDADDLQYIYDLQVVRAKNAKIKLGKSTYVFSDLYLELRSMKGYGITEVSYLPIARVRYIGGIFWFDEYNEIDDKFEPVHARKRLANMEVSKAGIAFPANPPSPKIFDYVPIRVGGVAATQDEVKNEKTDDFTLARITAKRVTFVSRREIQFQRATIYQGEAKVLSLPLFRLDTLSMQSQFPTEQFVSVNNNQFGFNYPFYMSLGHEGSSDIRFSTGQNYGRGFTANRGVFFDYEQDWNKSNGNGNFRYSGIGRDDFDLGLRQFLKFNDSTTGSFAFDSPRAKSLISTGTLSHYDSGVSTSLTGTTTRAFDNTPGINRQDYFLVMEKDPIKLGKLPWSMFYGVNATYSQAAATGVSRAAGARLRFLSQPIHTDRNGGTITSGMTFGQYSGTNVITPFTSSATVSYYKAFGQRFNSTVTYDYTRDGVTEKALGLHRFTSQLNYFDHRFASSIFATKGVGVDSLSFFADTSYRFSDLWRVGYQYTLNRYSGTNYLDYNVVLAYRLSAEKPEFGLMYSQQTKRVGIVLLGISRF